MQADFDAFAYPFAVGRAAPRSSQRRRARQIDAVVFSEACGPRFVSCVMPSP